MNRCAVILPLLLILSLTACKPSADESLDKIARAWQINKYYADNSDLTPTFKSVNKNYTLQFYEDYTYMQSAVVNDTFRTTAGTWQFNETLDSLYLYNDVDSHYYFIRLLRLKNLNIREVISTTTHDYLMVDY